MKTITATELKTKCLALLDEIARTGTPVLVTKHGKPIAQLGPPARPRYSQDSLLGTGEILGDIVSPPSPADDWYAERGLLDGKPVPADYQREASESGKRTKAKRSSGAPSRKARRA